MSYVIVALVIVATIEAGGIAVLLAERTQRMRADRGLRESEGKFRLITERAPVIVWTARPDTLLDYVNTTCVEFTGLPMEELLDEGWLNVVHPDDLERCTATYVPAFEARSPFLFEYRARRSDGAYRWLLAHGVPKYDPDGSFSGYLGCDVDITERKAAEDRIRAGRAALEVSQREIQHLAGRLIEAQDAERARLARDLHDDVSQQLAGLSIALSGLRRRLGELQLGDKLGEDVQADLSSLHERTAVLAQNVRHLSHDLHPTVLRHAGLVAALTSYCAEVERVHGAGLARVTVLKCSAEGDFAFLAPEVALCLYRIAQEGLRNVIVHAGASRADVRLLRSGDHVELTIVDDGRGFDVTSSLTRGKGLGLVSISERAKLASGTVSITSEPGEGTIVHVRIPNTPLAKNDEGSGAQDGRREYSLS